MPTKKTPDFGKDSRFAEVVDQLASGHKTIGQMVYAVLREAIISGAFAPGEWLRQESIATAIGVSRIPVRTALLQLESEGLVNFHPHRGARVRSLEPEQIDEIYRLRMLLESYAMRLSMSRMDPVRLTVLEELARKLDEQPDGGEFIDVRVHFYRVLYDAEHNPLLSELIEELRSRVGRYLLRFRLEHHNESKHVELIKRVRNGDLVGAEAWLYSHLDGVSAGIQKLAASAGDGDDDDGEADEPSAPGAGEQDDDFEASRAGGKVT